MPLRRVVTELTNEAEKGNPESVRKAIKSWHNKLAGGSIPRSIVTKLGKELFLDVEKWDEWLEQRQRESKGKNPGRPRTA